MSGVAPGRDSFPIVESTPLVYEMLPVTGNCLLIKEGIPPFVFVIASVGRQSPGSQRDCFDADGDSQ